MQFVVWLIVIVLLLLSGFETIKVNLIVEVALVFHEVGLSVEFEDIHLKDFDVLNYDFELNSFVDIKALLVVWRKLKFGLIRYLLVELQRHVVKSL